MCSLLLTPGEWVEGVKWVAKVVRMTRGACGKDRAGLMNDEGTIRDADGHSIPPLAPSDDVSAEGDRKGGGMIYIPPDRYTRALYTTLCLLVPQARGLPSHFPRDGRN